jgi:hypothetical protein
MSLHLEFEPHSWYQGFAIKHDTGEVIGADEPLANENTQYCADGCKYTNDGYVWEAYTANGMTGYIDSFHADTLRELKAKIKQYREG